MLDPIQACGDVAVGLQGHTACILAKGHEGDHRDKTDSWSRQELGKREVALLSAARQMNATLRTLKERQCNAVRMAWHSMEEASKAYGQYSRDFDEAFHICTPPENNKPEWTAEQARAQAANLLTPEELDRLEAKRPSPYAAKLTEAFSDAIAHEVAEHFRNGRPVFSWRDGQLTEEKEPSKPLQPGETCSTCGEHKMTREEMDAEIVRLQKKWCSVKGGALTSVEEARRTAILECVKLLSDMRQKIEADEDVGWEDACVALSSARCGLLAMARTGAGEV